MGEEGGRTRRDVFGGQEPLAEAQVRMRSQRGGGASARTRSASIGGNSPSRPRLHGWSDGSYAMIWTSSPDCTAPHALWKRGQTSRTASIEKNIHSFFSHSTPLGLGLPAAPSRRRGSEGGWHLRTRTTTEAAGERRWPLPRRVCRFSRRAALRRRRALRAARCAPHHASTLSPSPFLPTL